MSIVITPSAFGDLFDLKDFTVLQYRLQCIHSEKKIHKIYGITKISLKLIKRYSVPKVLSDVPMGNVCAKVGMGVNNNENLLGVPKKKCESGYSCFSTHPLEIKCGRCK